MQSWKFIQGLALAGLFLFTAVVPVHGALGVAISTPDMPAVVGKQITWSANNFPPRPYELLYRFRLTDSKGALVALTSGTDPQFEWLPLAEGVYELTITVQDRVSGEVSSAVVPFVVGVELTEGVVVRPTRHPLVATYTANCPAGRMRVQFAPVEPRQQGPQWTPFQPCGAGRVLTFLVAGMLEETEYQMQAEVVNGSSSRMTEPVRFKTGAIPDEKRPRALTIQRPQMSGASSEKVILQGFTSPGQVAAFDNLGRVVWYYDDPAITPPLLIRPLAGGTMLFVSSDATALREVDLAGNLLREITIAEASEQLKALGHPGIIGLHHDAVRLANGYTAVLTTIEQLADQGQGIEDVNGDGIAVLDENWRVVWAWNPFEKLDLKMRAVLNEKCSGRCATLLPVANDWTHTNTLQYLEDGNFLMSMRSLDWAVKVDYRDGKGTGDVIWRMGPGGDFRAVSDDPWPWFTHQHTTLLAGDRFIVFDNGNTRVTRTRGGNSRGQVWTVDEKNRTATLDLNADLGTYSFALGSAQRLANGNYQFLSGAIRTAAGFRTEATEVAPRKLPEGEVVFKYVNTGMTYRSYRMADLYTP